MKKISVIFGTRPEAIKLAPVILKLKELEGVACHICVTAQHRQMLDQVLQVFDITPDVDLDLMTENQTLPGFTAKAIVQLSSYLMQEKPDLVLVQGDTTTVLCATLAAFYQHIPIGHVEAGLRTWDLSAPWPEEANRVLTSHLASLHFAPTRTSRDNLLREGVPRKNIHVTGNPVIDALFLALKEARKVAPVVPGLPDDWPHLFTEEGRRLVLITGHRRENLGEGFEDICRGVSRLAQQFQDVHFVYPVHLNPNVRKTVHSILGTRGPGALGQKNIHLIEPLSYLPFVRLMDSAYLILTDSGGVQEEAPSLGKPVLVMRTKTERPEAVQAGTVRIMGTKTGQIVRQVTRLLTRESEYGKMKRAHNPYGRGDAADRIIHVLRRRGFA
ncbi:MAG: UDP-N-acetylglucosamine 2-epimerase (non-hydrolyzing) [Spartobacteria bacterium]|nr:UDP-N-acetylglucosamine 2-epimerase (non-hydrolyzing) [Spartobacteria bacterium]